MIGNGTPEEARAFAERGKHAFPIYVDPRLRAYRAAGLRRGVTKVLNLKALANARRASAEGHAQGRTAGDPWQLGGVFAILPGGRVVFEQRSDAAGDHADPAAVLDALRSAASAP